MRFVAALLAASMLAGCVSWDARKADMQSRFMGKPIDDVIRALGVPSAQARLSDGSQVVEFVTYRGNFRCDDQFTTDPQGTVVSSRHGGQNGCAIR